MNSKKTERLVSLSFASMLLLSSCMDKDVYQGEQKNKPLNPTEVFDFSLMKQVNLSVDYGFTNDYYIIFELYGQNPLKEENGSQVKDETLSPLYAASTDKQGKYSSTIQIPSDVTEVWLYTDYLGAISPVRLAVSADGAVSFNQNKYIASLQATTKAITAGGHNYLDDWMTMTDVDWNQYGFPTNMETKLSMPPAKILYSIKNTYSKINGKKIKDLHPEWLNGNTTSEIKITKNTELSLVFINSGAVWSNVVGYFTYPTGSEPTPSNVQKIIAFPNASPISKISNTEERLGELLCGHEVKLKYWDGTKFEDEFPAGVTIGWCLEGFGFEKGDIIRQKYAGTRYSYDTMNEDKAQRVVALRDADSDQIVAIGFEDNTDYDYCDAIFYLKIAETGAIDPEGPTLPPVDPPANVTVSYKGTLAFEDQWPSTGDYDMNDVVMEYRSTIYKNALTDKVYQIVDEFTPVHDGASFTCGFGYQLTQLAQGGVREITVDGPEGWTIENDQTHPTIILFNSQKQVMGKKYTVTIDLADVDKSAVMPPYNPFLFVKDRSVEVHLVNYPPTDKANRELFNTRDDVSDINNGIYYIVRHEGEVALMPFGINIPTLDFKVPTESVKIYEDYPGFIGWVESGGKTNADWYKK